MAGKNGLCEKIGEMRNVQAVFLVHDGSIVQWKARRGVRTPSPEQMDNVVVQRHMILALARAHEGFLGKFHYNLSRYDDSDILLFDTPAGKKSMLMVMVKKPYELDGLLHEIRGALRDY
ncbi:MAG: hypothetical protein QXJ74_00030 [Nitrososphaera sp.]|uniref:hypothetical protein n=2 Tax=Nitrososphaera sp. TaxID=1971748 RepID=UPI0017B592F5|nr:hypothetical protein [Nitrososphaera sp.]